MLGVRILTLAFACAAGFSLAVPAAAETCRWGGDESQSMRCFDCMKPVWNGQRWTLKDVCRPHGFNDFQQRARP
jgi:hypothetical protein